MDRKFVLFTFIIVISSINCTHGGVFVDLAPAVGDNSNPKLNVGPALRFLTKGVFTRALLKGSLTGDMLVSSALTKVSIEDVSDCAKKLICVLQSKKDLSWDEQLIKNTIPPEIEYTSPTIQLELAADLGRKKGTEQCSVVYSRCALEFEDLMELLRQSGTSVDIPTDDDYDCTVLFLWNRKKSNATLDNNTEDHFRQKHAGKQ